MWGILRIFAPMEEEPTKDPRWISMAEAMLYRELYSSMYYWQPPPKKDEPTYMWKGKAYTEQEFKALMKGEREEK